ncbi:MAG: hypothetical protein A3F40_04120 [Chlamydiae bacterium RIFCSPHIGHO2_12_FULL_27_8]|nr:MAG: hypothetical protein A3F40_04120 [Chlamydiae bacterium RIFCSPHIGHO2_12_FULL_27_8]
MTTSPIGVSLTTQAGQKLRPTLAYTNPTTKITRYWYVNVYIAGKEVENINPSHINTIAELAAYILEPSIAQYNQTYPSKKIDHNNIQNTVINYDNPSDVISLTMNDLDKNEIKLNKNLAHKTIKPMQGTATKITSILEAFQFISRLSQNPGDYRSVSTTKPKTVVGPYKIRFDYTLDTAAPGAGIPNAAAAPAPSDDGAGPAPVADDDGTPVATGTGGASSDGGWPDASAAHVAPAPVASPAPAVTPIVADTAAGVGAPAGTTGDTSLGGGRPTTGAGAGAGAGGEIEENTNILTEPPYAQTGISTPIKKAHFLMNGGGTGPNYVPFSKEKVLELFNKLKNYQIKTRTQWIATFKTREEKIFIERLAHLKSIQPFTTFSLFNLVKAAGIETQENPFEIKDIKSYNNITNLIDLLNGL